jgi:hypothetical protein
MILVKLHCVRKHELDVLGELSDIRVLLPFKVFLRSVFVKSINIHFAHETHVDLLKAHRARYCLVVNGPYLLAGQFHEIVG